MTLQELLEWHEHNAGECRHEGEEGERAFHESAVELLKKISQEEEETAWHCQVLTKSLEGWTNRETWATMLHIDNDQVLLEIAMDYAKQEIEGHDEGEEINPYHLGETIKNWIEEDLLTRDNIAGNQGLWLMLTDIGSLYRVNWQEIAQSLIENAKEGVSA